MYLYFQVRDEKAYVCPKEALVGFCFSPIPYACAVLCCALLISLRQLITGIGTDR